jgi:hypothetical protein
LAERRGHRARDALRTREAPQHHGCLTAHSPRDARLSVR